MKAFHCNWGCALHSWHVIRNKRWIALRLIVYTHIHNRFITECRSHLFTINTFLFLLCFAILLIYLLGIPLLIGAHLLHILQIFLLIVRFKYSSCLVQLDVRCSGLIQLRLLGLLLFFFLWTLFIGILRRLICTGIGCLKPQSRIIEYFETNLRSTLISPSYIAICNSFIRYDFLVWFESLLRHFRCLSWICECAYRHFLF